MQGRAKKEPAKTEPGAKTAPANKSGRPRKRLLVAAGVVAVLVIVVPILLTAKSGSKYSPAAAPVASPSAHDTVCKNQSPAFLNPKILHSKPYPMTIDENATYEADLATSCGTMVIRFFPKQAPIAVNNFIHLAQDDFYTGQVFHRIDPQLGVIQAGDPACPTSTQVCGTGGPGYTIKDEFHNGLTPHLGTVAMASAGTPNSSGSQFEIIAGKSEFQLPPERTIFGELVGSHSFQVAHLILSIPTKIAPNAPSDAPSDYPDGEFVYITSIKIVKKG